MADLDQLSSSVQSDIQLLVDLFRDSQLNMQDLFNEESAEDTGLYIKQLLALPSSEIISAATPTPRRELKVEQIKQMCK